MPDKLLTWAEMIKHCPCLQIFISLTGGIASYMLKGDKSIVMFIRIVFVAVFIGTVITPLIIWLAITAFDVDMPLDVVSSINGILSIFSWQLVNTIEFHIPVIFSKVLGSPKTKGKGKRKL